MNMVNKRERLPEVKNVFRMERLRNWIIGFGEIQLR